MSELAVALRFAGRELRGGLAGFRIFVACLALGVAAIAGVNSVSQAVEGGLRADARRLAGGDVVVRTTYTPADDEQRAVFEAAGRVSESIEMRAMAQRGTERRLIELKAVDAAYPVYGAVVLDPAMPLGAALAGRGAVVDRSLLDQLGVRVGDRIAIGDAQLEIRAAIAREPDRGIDLFAFGPRVLTGLATVPATGLLRPGSLVRYNYRIRLPAGADARSFTESLAARFPDAGWRVTRFDEATPGLRRMVDRLTLFLTLVGVTALLIGGVGVANAVAAFLGGKTGTIATLKCLGASGRTVFVVYLAQILALATVGIGIGLVGGAAVPYVLAGLLAGLLPVAPQTGLFPGALALAAAFGLLTALAFSLWPLARAREIPPASLFRDLVARRRAWPAWPYVAATAVVAALLVGLTVAAAPERHFAAWYAVGAAAAVLLFLAAAWLVMRAAAAAPRPRATTLRLALAALCRPGAPTVGIVLSLGFAVSVLVAVALIEGNLARLVRERLPEAAPTFFFIDIQPDQADGFWQIARKTPGVEPLARMPHIRARIAAIDGVPVARAAVAPEAQWALRNERGLTYAAEPPPGTRLVAGAWWPPDYAGPPAVSFDAALARGFGIGVGDTITFNVLGREIEARVASLREIDWSALRMQFTVIFDPATLAAAPQTLIATARAAPEAEAPLLRAVGAAYPNISAIRVRDAIDAVDRVMRQIGTAVRATALVTLVAGALVLGGAIAAGQRRRIYEAVVLKVLGATRADVLTAQLAEFAALGLATALIGAVVGTAAAWAVVTQVMEMDWVWLPGAALAGIALCLLVTLAGGGIGVLRALGRKPAAMLRHA